MGQSVDLPDWAAIRGRFDAALIAPVDTEQAPDDAPEAVMLRALGLR